MAHKLILKNSSTANRVPEPGDSELGLSLGEVAINTNDGNFFFRQNDGTEHMLEIRPADVGQAAKLSSGDSEPQTRYKVGDIHFNKISGKYSFVDSDGWKLLFESMREEIRELTQSNIMPQAGYGAENTVPISGNSPNAIMGIAVSQDNFVDKEGQQCMFYISKSAYNTRNLARARLISGEVVVDDFYSEPVGGSGSAERYTYIYNMDRHSAHLYSAAGQHELFELQSSGSISNWNYIANVSTENATVPAGLDDVTGSSFKWVPEHGKAIRFAYSTLGRVAVEIYTVDSAAKTVSLENSWVVLDIEASGTHAADFTGNTDTWTNHFGSDYSIGCHFGYSYEEQRLIHRISTYRVTNGTAYSRSFLFNISVPNDAFTTGGTAPSTNITTYQIHQNIGNGTNGVISSSHGATYAYTWDSYSSKWIYQYNSYWATSLGGTDFTADLTGNNYSSWSYPGYTNRALPDSSLMAKQVRSYGTTIGDNHIVFNGGLSTTGGGSWTSITAPFNGTYDIEGNTNYYVQVGSATATNVGAEAIMYVDGRYYSCTGLGQPVYRWTEDPTNGWSAAATGVTAPASIPANGGTTYTGVGYILYDWNTGNFFQRAYSSANPAPSVTLVEFDASTSNDGGLIQNDLVRTSLRGYYGMMLSGDNLYVNMCWNISPGVQAQRFSRHSKASVQADTGTDTEVDRMTSAYTGYGTQWVSAKPNGDFYIARASSSPTVIYTNSFSNEANFLGSDYFGNGGGFGTRVDIAAVSAAGFTVVVEQYPLFIGGYQCTIAKQSLTGKANSVHYVLAQKDPADTTTVILSLIDYLPSGLEDTFDSYTQVCLSTFTTNADRIISKTDRAIVRA